MPPREALPSGCKIVFRELSEGPKYRAELVSYRAELVSALKKEGCSENIGNILRSPVVSCVRTSPPMLWVVSVVQVGYSVESEG